MLRRLIIALARAKAGAQQFPRAMVIGVGFHHLRLSRHQGSARRAQAVFLIGWVKPRYHLAGCHAVTHIDQPFHHAPINAEANIDLGFRLDGPGQGDDGAIGALGHTHHTHRARFRRGGGGLLVASGKGADQDQA